jgi:hypothetical protein
MATSWSTPVLVEHQYNIPLRALYLHLEPNGDLMAMVAMPVLPTMEPPPVPATLDSALASLGWIERGSGRAACIGVAVIPVTRLPARPPTYGMIRQ